MFEKIISMRNLLAAWRVFRAGKRGKEDVQLFERHLEDNLFSLREELVSGKYCHGPYERFHIHDPKPRVIHKASVRDRIVHHAMYRVLASVFDRSFIFDSYSCRTMKGTHAAVRRLERFGREVSRNYSRTCWALKCDIKKFFDSIDHAVLKRVLGQKIECVETLRLAGGIIDSYSAVDNIAERERESSRESLSVISLPNFLRTSTWTDSIISSRIYCAQNATFVTLMTS